MEVTKVSGQKNGRREEASLLPKTGELNFKKISESHNGKKNKTREFNGYHSLGVGGGKIERNRKEGEKERGSELGQSRAV